MQKTKKRRKLRHNEYYDMQQTFDNLYERSCKNHKFKNLLEIISREENIMLAYRNIKRNKGSNTVGVNNRNIEDVSQETRNRITEYVRNRLDNFIPHKIKRVEIPKRNGKTRPLGIPTIEDRLIQQCILQVLEPICEAKFYTHSYGFRPNRNTSHAMARVHHLISNEYHYAVDVDIKGFFDNISHGKLMKQMYSLGIHDKKILKIISKMLKAEVEGEGVQSKGTIQGGIISPLLSNIVLNELDWWIAKQWHKFPTKHKYSKDKFTYRHLREKSNLKDGFIVRYADDFKILCKDYQSARKFSIATQQWLKDRLGLEINKDKSKVVNLRKNYSNFLGFKIKVKPKKRKNNKIKYVPTSHMEDKAKEKVIESLIKHIKKMQDNPYAKMVHKFNSAVLGFQNYYKTATNVFYDFEEINYKLSRKIYNRLIVRGKATYKGTRSTTFNKCYGKMDGKTMFIQGVPLFPIWKVKTSPPMKFSPLVCNYTTEGRNKIHNNLKTIDYSVLQYLMRNYNPSKSMEFNDNRISKYVAQKGKCYITGDLLTIGYMELHHVVPKALGGTDEYKNLIFISKLCHKTIHATNQITIDNLMKKLKPKDSQIKKINSLRIKASLNAI